jgi:vacuolar-type H+-ATPase subunit E/Vma4
VCAAIAEEAAIEIERMEQDLIAARERLIAARPVPARLPELDRAVAAAAARLAEADQATASTERRLELEERETWLQQAVARGVALLAQAPPAVRRQRLLMLAVEAAAALPVPSCVIEVPADMLQSCDARWIAEVEFRTSKSIAVEHGAHADGCIAVSPDRRLWFDNTVAARIARLEGAWRRALCRRYTSSIEPAPAADGSSTPLVVPADVAV